jgi:N-acetylglucosaminyl-diphospho-decaprenol L-rhamnosyltransferase
MHETPGQPDLSVIVVTHNRTELALRTLRRAHAAVGSIGVEWYVVDSGSHEPTAEAIEREWPDVHVIRGENAGFAAANNRALREARGRYVLLLNPDVEVLSGTFAALVSALDKRPEVGMASVMQRAPDGSLDYSIRRDPSPWRTLGEALAPGRLTELCGWGEIYSDAHGYRAERSADWLCGAFLIARAEAVRDVGPLDERFFLYSEETDWCYRCRRAGWDVRHLPVMDIVHHKSDHYGAELLAQLSYSRLLFARKHLGARKATLMRAAVAVRHMTRALAFGALRPVRPALAARASAETRALSVVLDRAAAPFPRQAPR